MGNETDSSASGAFLTQDGNAWKNESSTPTNPNDSPYALLKEYETSRRLRCSAKFDSMSLYWKSYRDLLRVALLETSRAQRLVLGTCRAHQVYAGAMSAMHDDVFLDERGNVANEKQQKRLLAARKERPNRGAESEYHKSVLVEIRESQRSVAGSFGENAKNMDEEIAEAIGALLEGVKKHHSTMEELGSSVLSELEKTESEVISAWSRYLSQNDGTTRSTAGYNLLASPEVAPHNIVYDIWVVETQYRVAVAYQNAAWENGSKLLDDLFRKVNQEEILRRMNLREFLVAFVQRQQRLFLSLPSIHNKVLEELVGKETSRAEIERNVSAAVKIGDRQAEFSTKGSPTLESPLTSDLLCKAKVVERRVVTAGAANTANGPDWRLALAVMTVDAYLHFFDLDAARLSLSSSPEKAFQVLMPSVVVPTAENLMLGKSNFHRGWSDSLIPTDSIVLARSVLQSIDEKSFAIVEKGGTLTTASKMFGKLGDKKVQIRTLGKADKDEWTTVLMSQM